jgi:hypothetical protein
MPVDPQEATEVIEQFQLAQRSLPRSREPEEANKRMREVTNQARRVLNNLPQTCWEGSVKQLAMQLAGEIELAEGSLRGRARG